MWGLTVVRPDEKAFMKHNFHAIVGPNGMCECGVRADGSVVTCQGLLEAEILHSEKDNQQLRAFLEREGYRRCDAPACNCGSWHQQKEATRAK